MQYPEMLINDDFVNAWSDSSLYQKAYELSVKDIEQFWRTQADYIYWKEQPTKIYDGCNWLIGGKSSLYYNCVTRHVISSPDKIAFINYSDNPTSRETITYENLDILVKKIVKLLKNKGIKKNDVVAILMPTRIISIASMLACACIGALHMVVFSGFSADVLAWRIKDSNAKLLLTLHTIKRNGKEIDLVKSVDSVKNELLNTMPEVVYMDDISDVSNLKSKSVKDNNENDIEWLDNQDEAFVLYTSGTSGKFKGVVHATLPYMLYMSSTFKNIFNPSPDDIYFCTSDIGWITGHSYLVYAPLFWGLTSVIFDGTPLYPTPDRYWDIIQKERVNIFYTAPTALRTLKALDDEYVKKHDLSSLRILGSVGEPINETAWQWYFEIIGKNKCPIIDTWWQTETGGIVLAPLRNLNQLPGVAGKPFFGINVSIINEQLVIDNNWPGKYKRILNQDKQDAVYKSGDCAEFINDNIKITGRVDDVINISGHRLCTTEFERALSKIPVIAESATVAIPHEITGQAVVVFAVLKLGVENDSLGFRNNIDNEIRQVIRKSIGAIAKPYKIVYLKSLPKTTTGKIERHKLRELAIKN